MSELSSAYPEDSEVHSTGKGTKMRSSLTSEQVDSINLAVDQFIFSLTYYVTVGEKLDHLQQCALSCGTTKAWVIEYAKERIKQGLYGSTCSA